MSSFESVCVKEVTDPRTTDPHILPIYQTSSFVFDNIDQGIRIFSSEENGHVYTRYGNPTFDAVAAKIADLETHDLDCTAHGVMFSSGMAALHTLVLSTLKQGQKILTQGNLYGGSTELLTSICSRSGVQTIFTDLSDYHAVDAILAADDTIGLVFFETPANPTLQCVDMRALSEIAHNYKRLIAADNTFATPYLQQPFQFGIDFVMHSTTKFLNGHGNATAGILLGRDIEFMKNEVNRTMKLTGNQPGVLDAWLTYQGMKTLAVRMDRHCSNAMAIARFLEDHDAVAKVNYIGLPGHPDHELARRQMRDFGSMVSFEIRGGVEAGVQFMRNVRLCVLAPTLGDVDTLVLHPASMSHRNIPREMREINGITDGMVRLSVGIEHVNDLIGDLENALHGL